MSDQVKSVATSLKDCLDPKKIEVAVIEQLPAAAIQQVSSLTQFIYCRLFIKIIGLPGGQINDSLSAGILFFFIQQFIFSEYFKTLKILVSDWLLKIFNQ